MGCPRLTLKLIATQVLLQVSLVAFLLPDSRLIRPSLLQALTLEALRPLVSSHHLGDKIETRMAAAKSIWVSVRGEQ